MSNAELIEKNLAGKIGEILRRGPGDGVCIDYAPNGGGYENYVYAITADGGVLAIDTVIAEIAEIDFTDPDDKQWFIIGYEVNYENQDLYDDHTGKRVEPAYD